MLALLRTRRWLGFTALVLGVIIAFGALSAWQWSRAEQRREERVALQAALAVAPVPLASLDLSSLPAVEWRPVRVQGRYVPELQTLVRKRPLDAVNGFWVMTVLRPSSGAAVWVNRGWVAAGEDALATPSVPAPPAGEVEVTGFLRALEDADPSRNDGLPRGQVAAPAAKLLPAAETMPAYLQLSASTPPEDGLVPLPLPTIDEGRNVSYAIQWILFAAIAAGGWYVVLRRESRQDAEVAAGASRTEG